MSINLDTIRAALDAKYAHTPVQIGPDSTILLLNPTRLPREARRKVNGFSEAYEALDKDDLDAQEDAIRDLLASVAETPEAGRKLLAAIDKVPGDALQVLMSIVGDYLGAQGEAQPSES